MLGNFEGLIFMMGNLLIFCSSIIVDAHDHTIMCMYKRYLAGLINPVCQPSMNPRKVFPIKYKNIFLGEMVQQNLALRSYRYNRGLIAV